MVEMELLRRLVLGDPCRYPDELDLAKVRALARAHGLSGLLARALSHGPKNLAWLAAMAQADWVSQRRSSAVLELELARLNRRYPYLSPPIVLKGFSVASLYGDPSLRTGNDLDLLVPRTELREWGRVLAAEGYRPLHNPAFDRRFLHAVPYGREMPGTRIEIDLHFRLWIEPRIDRVRYEQLRPFALRRQDQMALELRPDAMVVQLAINLIRDAPQARRLVSYRDLIEAGPDRLVQARSLARSLGVDFAVEAALRDLQAFAEGSAFAQHDDWMNLIPDGRRMMAHHISRIRNVGFRRLPMYAFTWMFPRHLLRRASW